MENLVTYKMATRLVVYLRQLYGAMEWCLDEINYREREFSKTLYDQLAAEAGDRLSVGQNLRLSFEDNLVLRGDTLEAYIALVELKDMAERDLQIRWFRVMVQLGVH
jgi:hypothetical protein